MSIVLISTFIFMVVSLTLDLILSKVGTERGLAYEGNALFRSLDGKFVTLRYLAVHIPLVALFAAPTVYLTLHPLWPEAVIVMCAPNVAIGAYHLPAIIAWIRLFRQ